MGRRKRRRQSTRHIPWATLAVIGGLLLVAMALVSLGLEPQGGVRVAVWVAVAAGVVVAVGGALGLMRQRLRGRSGLMMPPGGQQALLWPGVLGLLVLGFLSAVLPIPYPSPWLSLVAPLVFLGGAAGLVGRILSDAAPVAYHRALRAYRDGDRATALALVRQAIAERPDDASNGTYAAHHLEAILLREEGKLAQAREVADRLVARRPELYYGHAEQGMILLAGGDARGASEALQRAVARAPHLAEAHYNLGMARAEAGDSAGAVGALTHALRLGLGDEVTRLMAHYQLYRAYESLGLGEEAAAESRWLRRHRGTLRRWRQALAADVALPRERRRRDEQILAAIEAVIKGQES